MKGKCKRILSTILALVMVLALLPATALAKGDKQPQDAYFYVLKPGYTGTLAAAGLGDFYYVGKGSVKYNTTAKFDESGIQIDNMINAKPTCSTDAFRSLSVPDANNFYTQVGENFANVIWYRTVQSSGANGNIKGPDGKYNSITSATCWHVDGVAKPVNPNYQVQFILKGSTDELIAVYNIASGTAISDTQINNATSEANKKAPAGQTVQWYSNAACTQSVTNAQIKTETGSAAATTILRYYGTFVNTMQDGSVTVQVMLDGTTTKTAADVNTYITVTPGAGTASGVYNNGTLSYKYDTHNCADFTVTAKTGYVIEGVSATLLYGESGSNGITESTGTVTVDNAKGGSTVTVYVRTAYTVEYYKDSTKLTDSAYTDSSTYVTGKTSLTAATNKPANGDNTTGTVYTYVAQDNLKTAITLPALPTASVETKEVSGWYKTLEEAIDRTKNTAGTSVNVAAVKPTTGNVIKFYARESDKPAPIIAVSKELTSIKRGDTTYTKTASNLPTTLYTGDVLTWTVTVTNSGNAAATGLALTDTLKRGVDAITEGVTITPPSGVDKNNFNVPAKSGNTDGSVVFTVTYTVTSADVGYTLFNTASVGDKSSDPVPSGTVAPTVTIKYVKDDATGTEILSKNVNQLVKGADDKYSYDYESDTTKIPEEITVNNGDETTTKYVKDSVTGDLKNNEVNADVTIIVTYTEDSIGGGTDCDEPNGTGDKYEIIFTYVAGSNGSFGTDGEGDPITTVKEAVVKKNNGNISADGTASPNSVPTPVAATGYVFYYWQEGDDTTTQDTSEAMTTLKADTYSEDTTFTAYFDEDKLVDPTVPEAGRPENGGDGIPDSCQIEVTFEAVNGTFTGVAAPGTSYTTVVTKRDSSGQPDANGTAKLAAAHIKEAVANEGYLKDSGTWTKGSAPIAKPVAGTEVNDKDVFTVTFAKSYTVIYTDGVEDEEVFKDQSYDVALNAKTPEFRGDTPTREGYVFEGWYPAVAETVTESVTYVAQWAEDKWLDADMTDDESDIDGPGSDGIADYTQVVVAYKSNNTSYGTVDKDFEVFTLVANNDGEYIGTVTATGSTATAKSGYRFVNWTDENKTQVSTDVKYVPNIKNAVGGTTYTFTANFTVIYYPPVVNDPTIKVKGLNTVDHVAYIIGVGNDEVNPLGTITRAEIANIYFRLMTDEFRSANWGTDNRFKDVPDDAWYTMAVLTLDKAGIITDSDDGNFRPNDPITRAELAVMAAQFCTVTGKIPATSFKDVPSTHWAAKEIALIEYAGWIEGYAGYFRPDDNLTRAEAVTIVNRMLQRGAEEENMLPDMVTFVDNADPDMWYYEAIQEAANAHDYTRTTKLLTGETFRGEKWTALLEATDWAALEQAWIAANSK